MEMKIKFAGPMDWATYREMPDSFQRAYYRAIREEFGVDRQKIADMFQTTLEVVEDNLDRLGVDRDDPGFPKDYFWHKFLAGLFRVRIDGINEDPDVEPKAGKQKFVKPLALEKIQKLEAENNSLREILKECRDVIASQVQQISDLRLQLDTQVDICMDDIGWAIKGKESRE